MKNGSTSALRIAAALLDIIDDDQVIANKTGLTLDEVGRIRQHTQR